MTIDIHSMRYRVTHGLPLTLEEQRWLLEQYTGEEIPQRKRCGKCGIQDEGGSRELLAAMGEDVILYRVDTKNWLVVPVECPNGRFPAKDADGETVFDNTHFGTEAEAIRNLLANAEAFVKLSAGSLEDARARMLKCERECGEAAIAYAKAYELWQEKVL